MHGQEAEAQEAAELSDPGVLITATSRGGHGEPDAVGGCHAVYGLQNQIQGEAELQLDHRDGAVLAICTEANAIAAADLSFDSVALRLEVQLRGGVQGGFG